MSKPTEKKFEDHLSVKELTAFKDAKLKGGKLSDPKMAEFSEQVKSYSFNRFNLRLIELDKLISGSKSNTTSKLLQECRDMTRAAFHQYRDNQLFWTARFFLTEHMRLSEHLANGDEFIKVLSNSDSEKSDSIRDRYLLDLGVLKDRYSPERLSYEDVMLYFDQTASYLFNDILPLNDVDAHFSTLKEIFLTTLGAATPLGLIEYLRIIRKLEPTKRRQISLNSAESTLVVYEEYIDAIVVWIQASRAFQLLLEDEISFKVD